MQNNLKSRDFMNIILDIFKINIFRNMNSIKRIPITYALLNATCENCEQFI